MKLIYRNASLLIATLMLLTSAVARADEAAKSVTGTAPGVVEKVEKATERGAKAAVSGAERGLQAAGRGIEHGAKAAASGVERGAKAAGRGIERGAKATARGVERGAKATGNAAHTVAKKISGSPTSSSSPDK